MERRPPPERPYSVAVSLGQPQLKELIEVDLRRHGFLVRGDGDGRSADVLITDRRSGSGRRLTVHLNEDIEITAPGGTWWFAIDELGRLADLLGAELERADEEAAADDRVLGSAGGQP